MSWNSLICLNLSNNGQFSNCRISLDYTNDGTIICQVREYQNGYPTKSGFVMNTKMLEFFQKKAEDPNKTLDVFADFKFNMKFERNGPLINLHRKEKSSMTMTFPEFCYFVELAKHFYFMSKLFKSNIDKSSIILECVLNNYFSHLLSGKDIELNVIQTSINDNYCIGRFNFRKNGKNVQN